jgi:hypothetical protein
MRESEMEDLLWSHPERFLAEPLKQFRRQPHTEIGRPDLIFETRLDQLLLVEIKKGTAEREVIGQIYDYFGALKREFPLRSVELVVIATSIPAERKIALERLHIEWHEIPIKQFRTVARAVGYTIESEKALSGAGDIGDFGVVEVDYGEGNDFCDPGKWLAVVRDIDENRLDVEYFYDDDEPEFATLVKDRQGNWLDYNHDVTVTINFRPTPKRIEDFRRTVDSSRAAKHSN